MVQIFKIERTGLNNFTLEMIGFLVKVRKQQQQQNQSLLIIIGTL